MRHSDRELLAALADRGQVLGRNERPELLFTLQRHHRNGQLTLLLPRTYVSTAHIDNPAVRARAVCTWCPDAVLTGAIAARLTFWRELRVDQVEAAIPRQPRVERAGFTFSRRTVPPELVREEGGLRLTVPALSALDLVVPLGGEAIDRVLLRRAASLDDLHAALAATENRRHNTLRRLLLHDSRDEPWSEAERRAHRVLRGAGIAGWRSNWPVWIEGRCYILDIAFDKLRIAIEIDGRAVHSAASTFESDRDRQNALPLAGWLVLRFTWRMLIDEPDRVLATIAAAIALREAQCARSSAPERAG